MVISVIYENKFTTSSKFTYLEEKESIMNSYVYGIEELSSKDIDMVGGKGANLGELTRISSIMVPNGFCVSTKVYKELLEGNVEINHLLDELSKLTIEEKVKVKELSEQIRISIENISIPKLVKEEILLHLKKYGLNKAYAIRSSATSEDSILNSFAGQQDSYLNIMGYEDILNYIKKCWASLFNDRAILYRIKNGFSHNQVKIAVLVQEMVFSQASGVMFTADPITNNYKALTINASFGLGEAIVLGMVDSDSYKVMDGVLSDIKVGRKNLAIHGGTKGGTKEVELEEEFREKKVLSDEQILELYQIGRRIEKHYSQPQDIEWCLYDNKFYIVQSRPITTLFPVPKANDKEKHVYISVGHQQMMTDAMKPLGRSIFMLSSFGPRYLAGGRLFVDVTQMLASNSSRAVLLENMGQHDPLIKDALVTLIEEDYIKVIPTEGEENNKITIPANPMDSILKVESDITIVSKLMEEGEKSLEELKEKIQNKSGKELLDFMKEDLLELKSILMDPKSTSIYTQAIHASKWVNDSVYEWFGEQNVADILSQSVENNITSQMGLDLMKVADVIRPYKEVVEYLEQADNENYLEELIEYEGGEKAYKVIKKFLDIYGMRCSGEIDITRPRWVEKPTTLIPMILNNVRNSHYNAGEERFEQGRLVALKKEMELIERVKELPDGEKKAKDLKAMIDLIRNYIGYREYPKYMIVNRYLLYKKALGREAIELRKENVIKEVDDIYFLTFEELYDLISTKKLDYQLVSKRKEEHKFYEKLTPPRVITSDGEIIQGNYHQDQVPEGALLGLAVSRGVIEGRARIILNMEEAELLPGDILVTTFTDPSWTSLFISIKGLVTEVGGLMTHGAVIAREYGLPAVVGVKDATKLIKDGDFIRVHGTEGYVEILTALK